MRSIKFLLLALVLSLPAWGQSVVNNNASCSSTPCSVAAATSGNFLAGCFYNRNGTATTISSLSQTNVTWTFVDRVQATNVNLEIWWGKATGAGGTSVTITWGTGTSILSQITEFSGVDTTSPVDGTAAKNNGSSTTASSGTYTSANANDLLFHCVGSATNTAASAPTNSFNLLQGFNFGNSGTARAIGDAYRTVTSATSYTTALTVGNAAWGSVLIGFKASGAPSTSIKDLIGRGLIPVAR